MYRSERLREARKWERVRKHKMACARGAKGRIPLAHWDLRPEDWAGQVTQFVHDARRANQLARKYRNG